MEGLFGQIDAVGRHFGDDGQGNGTEAVSQRHHEPENNRIDLPPFGPDEIGGHHRFPVPRLQGVQRPQPEGRQKEYNG
jgi:hypothetical protein